MENRRIYLPPIQDMLNRPNAFVEQNDNSYEQYQVINGYETDFTSSTATVHKSNFTGQLFHDINAVNNAVPDLPIDGRAATAYYQTPPSSLSSPSSVTNSEILLTDVPKYRSTPPHSRSYSDHFPQYDESSRRLSASPSSRSPITQHKTNIIHHRRTTSDVTPFLHERKEYTTQRQQKQHLRNKSSAPSDEDIAPSTHSNTHYNRYQCSQCSKTFSRPSSLRIHIFSHTGEKPHECPHPGCGRRFSVQSNMRRHLKVHYCGPQSQQEQNYLGKLPLTQQQSGGYDMFIAEGGGNSSNGSKDFYRYSSVSRA